MRLITRNTSLLFINFGQIGNFMIQRALVVGLGSIGARHLYLLRESLPEAEILVLRHSHCDESIPDADNCTTSLEVACAFNPQIAIIASPAPFHLKAANALADQGTHLLIEKPLAESVGGVEEFLKKCRRKDVLVQVAYNLRLLDTLQRFRSEIAEGRIGKVLNVRCEIGQYLPGWRPAKDYRETVSAQRKLGGGVLLELSHELDMLRWVFGDVDWISGWNGTLSSLDIDVEDCGHFNLGFSSGAVCNLSMDFLRHDTTRCCTAIGEYGTLRWDAVSGELALFTPETNRWETLFQKIPERNDSYRGQLSSFLTATSKGRLTSEVATGEDGLATLQLIEAARRSTENSGQINFVEKVTTE
jgi:predicted dehydrogenase